MISFEFEGNQFEADETLLEDYEFMCNILTADESPSALVHCFRDLFCGKDREYAKVVGGKFAKMAELLSAAIMAAGENAKN